MRDILRGLPQNSAIILMQLRKESTFRLTLAPIPYMGFRDCHELGVFIEVKTMIKMCPMCKEEFDPRLNTAPYCKPCRKDYQKEYASRPGVKLRLAENRHRHHGKPSSKIKNSARHKVGSAMEKGLLVRQPCERCGTVDNIHAHHEDYSKPLDVNWLCRQHHHERHVEINEEKRREQ